METCDSCRRKYLNVLKLSTEKVTNAESLRKLLFTRKHLSGSSKSE